MTYHSTCHVYRLLVLITVLRELLCVHPLHKLVDEYRTLHRDDVRHSWQQLASSIEPIRVVELFLWDQMVHLHLKRNSDLFHPMAVAMEIDAVGNQRQHPINAHQFYTGHISDDVTSHVRAHVSPTGVLTAAVTTETDVIYIEPANKYLDESPDDSMVVYRKTDMLSRVDHKPIQFCDHGNTSHPPLPTLDVELTDDVELRRKKRASNNNTELVCLMHLVVDYQFFINRGQRSVSNIIIYVAVLVDTADEVFRNTEWESGVTSYGLQVGNITIYCSEGGVNFNHPTTPNGDKWTAEMLLREFSYNDWSEYCLAHLFTYYEFPNNTLGFAYVASRSTGNQGGICSSYRRRISTSSVRTSNVGLSSFANLFGKQLLQPQAEHIFTHELGHNWGSYHDIDTPECNPPFAESGGQGKYIMYPAVLIGTEPNNKVFSNCSKRRIASVLRTKSFCFIQRTQAICGNHRVDPGEDCDAGLLGCMNIDDCCHDNCTLKTGAECSDDNDQCCQQCQPAPANSSMCANQSDISCTEDVYCNGNSFTCPPATAKRNGSECIDDGQCRTHPADGSATCLTYCDHMFNMSPCVCDDDSQQCLFCCYNTTYGGCVAIVPTKNLPDGRPCEGGVCLSGKCDLQVKDFSTRLWKFLQTLSSDKISRFMRENIVLAVLVLSLLVYVPICCVVGLLDFFTERKYHDLFNRINRQLKLRLMLSSQDRTDGGDDSDTDSTGSTERLSTHFY